MDYITVILDTATELFYNKTKRKSGRRGNLVKFKSPNLCRTNISKELLSNKEGRLNQRNSVLEIRFKMINLSPYLYNIRNFKFFQPFTNF